MKSEKIPAFTPRHKPEGAISFTLSVSRTEDGKESIHLDPFEDPVPYGHISMVDARLLRDWLNKVLKI